MRLVNDAADAGCEVVAFSRDVDSDDEREDAIEEGIRRARELFADGPEIIGGVAKPALEGWILALLGERGSERLSLKRATMALVKKRVPAKDGPAMVRVVEREGLGAIPPDAASLRAWLENAEAVLRPLVANRAE
jgi:hypothetical protein